MPPHRLPAPPGFRGFLLCCTGLSVGVAWDALTGVYPSAWIGWLALAVALGLYMLQVSLAYGDRPARGRWVLGALAVLVTGMGLAYGSGWLYMFPLVAVACALVVPFGRALQAALLALAAVTAFVVWFTGDGISPIMAFSWGSFSAGVVVGFIVHLHTVIAELEHTRRRLAEAAVAEERLRFSRDLHDLLGHTLSVIVVKAEAVRRLAVRDPERAAGQAADIESVGRQALTEVREAVTGYREGSLATELERARETLAAAGVAVVVRRAGEPPSARAEALLCWVVREAATNILRHSTAGEAVFTVEATAEGTVLTVRDDGVPKNSARPPGSGLRGLSERLAGVGGSVTAGPLPEGGFEVRAVLRSAGS
ncbi:sensor histidine kinase [Nonomuraea typhae]|uniref:sensor histidine kinase n=1 Tax=Nonomuraea typhae TaxID=2603600 RepID=UPI0012FC7FF5|nr:histidine kinase [Nonomuraea typhae]